MRNSPFPLLESRRFPILAIAGFYGIYPAAKGPAMVGIIDAYFAILWNRPLDAGRIKRLFETSRSIVRCRRVFSSTIENTRYNHPPGMKTSKFLLQFCINAIECAHHRNRPNGANMNRRYFLGLALYAAISPALAKTKNSQPRILTLRHLHTDEKIKVTYRIGDHYQRDALRKLNHFLRDFRTGDTIAMDPKLFDLLYDINRRTRSDGVFEILSAYRSPKTNAMLRRTSRRVAKASLHMEGQAVDIRLEGASTRRVRDSALALGGGGVGYYPRSDFVHVDTGTVRRWGA